MNFFFYIENSVYFVQCGENKKKGTYSRFETELIFHLEELFQPCVVTQEVGNFF